MGQQPNIELEISDLPRPVAHPPPARRWRPERPGDFDSPDAVPRGDGFGTVGPDPGYALRLVRARSIAAGPGENPHNAEAAVAAVAAARAAAMGRAPIGEDVEVAVLLLGYDASAAPAEVLATLAERRAPFLAGIGHSSRRAAALVGAIRADLLVGDVVTVRSTIASGDGLIGA